MIRNFSADYIITVSGEPLRDGVITVNEEGEILKIYEQENSGSLNGSVEKFQGIITPGFVNSHCHLELSHLEQRIPKGKSLIPFIKTVLQEREADEEIIRKAMAKADSDMYENGIVAVGDISNNILSKEVKEKSSIYYHTYVEFLGFDPEKAEEAFNKSLALKESFYPLSTSIAPHAPYSVSKELFRLFKNYCTGIENPFSIHNQETEEENKLYRYKTGEFLDFYASMNLDAESFKPQARDSLQSIIPLLPKEQRILLVHNIYTSLKDIYFVRRFGRDITWCFCPNANLHIEKRLPKLDMFLSHDFNITLGTDSLASNDKLSILSEMQTLSKYFPSIPLTTMIQWATLNGAKFLGIDSDFGSIEKGKKPGLNLISNVKGMKLSPQSTVKKLI